MGEGAFPEHPGFREASVLGADGWRMDGRRVGGGLGALDALPEVRRGRKSRQGVPGTPLPLV